MSRYYKAEDVDLVCIKNFASGDVLSAIRSLPTIEVSEDCISRAVAIDIIKNYDVKPPEYMEKFANKLLDAIKEDLVEDIQDAPSAVPSAEVVERKPIMTEEVREALMRLTMCCMCKYKDTCGYDTQYEMATKNMNTIVDAFRYESEDETDEL